MSDNYRLYAGKMAALHAVWGANRSLHLQLIELLQFVLDCEAAWLD